MWSRVVLALEVVEMVLRNAINRGGELRDKRGGGGGQGRPARSDSFFILRVKVNFCLFKKCSSLNCIPASSWSNMLIKLSSSFVSPSLAAA